jgi:FixJ family two-component response regulator
LASQQKPQLGKKPLGNRIPNKDQPAAARSRYVVRAQSGALPAMSQSSNGNPTNATVWLVDDDAALLHSLRWLLESAHFRVQAYGSPYRLLQAYDAEFAGCVVADIRMPGMSGIELQNELRRRGCRLPIIFLTGHGDVATCTSAFRNGAFDFLEKPIGEQALIEVVRRAANADAKRRAQQAGKPDITALAATLTPREQQVMELLVAGKTVKQIAVELSVGFPTAARHRSRLLEKLRVTNDVELVRLLLA